MKTRKYYLLPLMAVTALSLSLTACDDKAENEAANTETTTEAPMATDTTAPVVETAPVMASVQVEGATAYATTEGSTTGAVFLTLHNTGTTADKLIGASTPVATGVELHQTTTDANGVASMNKVDAIEVPAGQQVVLSADGYHIMLTGLTAPLAVGTPFDVTLDFETGADVVTSVTVTEPTATAPVAGHTHTDHVAPATDATTVPSDTTATMPSADESPAAPVTTTDEPAPVVDAPADTTTAPAADAPVDEQPAQ